MERYFKGVSNHRRIQILQFVYHTDGVHLEGIAEGLNCNLKTISEHTRKLVGAGLLNKKYRGRQVAHTLSPYGKKFLNFIKSF